MDDKSAGGRRCLRRGCRVSLIRATDLFVSTECPTAARQRPAGLCRNGLCTACRMCGSMASYRFGGSYRLRLMSRFLGRDSRRRRVFNEEALSASSAHLAVGATRWKKSRPTPPRYSEAAGVEHHPQVTDFFPRRFRTIGALAAVGVGTTAAIEALHRFVAPLAGKYGFESTTAFDLSTSGNVASWISAVVLALASVTCVLIYSLRRHRIDDFKGRYRLWMAAAIAAAILSLESVAPVHRLVASVAAYHTGWTALRGHAAWWLLLAGLPLGWISLRAWLDARESRLAAVALGEALVAYCVAVASYLGIRPEISPQSELMVTAGATLVGHWMLLVGVVSYGRFVVLDAQGLIPRSERERTASKQARVPN